MPRVIKPRRIPGYLYTGPILRRSVRRQRSENLSEPPILDPVQEEVEPMQEVPVQEPPQEPMQEPMELDPIQEEPIQEPIEEQMQEPMQVEPMREPIQEPIQEPEENDQEVPVQPILQRDNLEHLVPGSARPTPPMSPQHLPQQNQESLDNLLSKIYRYKESPAAYSSAIQKYINTNYSLSLHKQKRKRFIRRPFLVYDPYDSIQADLVFYNSSDYYTKNSYYKYILTVIDMFSRYAYAVPLKTKNSAEVAQALDKIISSMPVVPRKLMVDAGTEFSGSSNGIYNIIIRKYKMVIYVLTDSDTKAGIVERFNRTMRERIARYMTDNNTKRWIDYLPELIANYNSTEHRSIGMAPRLVSFSNREEVFNKLYPNRHQKVKCKIKPGWRVRIPRKKSIFEKGFAPNWSNEIFIVKHVEQVIVILCKQT